MTQKSNKTKQEKTYYKVSFTRDNELYQICARNVGTSDWWGLIELSGFIFPENKLVYNPGEERIKREFSEIRRTWIPYHAIVRVDEVLDTAESEVKIVPLESFRRPPSPPLPIERGKE